MATQQDIKHAQKVLMASGVARAIFQVDVDRLSAALTLMTPGELERLDAIAHVAGMVNVDEDGSVISEPKVRQPRKPRAALGPHGAQSLQDLAAKTQAEKENGAVAHNGAKIAPNTKCLKPGCEFDADLPDSKFCRNHAEELRAT